MKIKKGDDELNVGLIETLLIFLGLGFIVGKKRYHDGVLDGRKEKKDELLLEIKDELRKESLKS
jgi:hypothetical protein